VRELAMVALELARGAGASFADLRAVELRRQEIGVERLSLKRCTDQERFGYAVRVLVDGSWGFATGTRLDRDEVARVARAAVSTARASARVPRSAGAVMAENPAAAATLRGPCIEDPFEVPQSEKAELLLSASAEMMAVAGVVSTIGHVTVTRMSRFIANTDGSVLDLAHTFVEPMLHCTAVVGGESQTRMYQGGGRQAGWEWMKEVDFAGNARRWAEDAVMKCTAETAPPGRYDLVLDPMHLSLTMHESVGHPTELDRILGWEANMAGRSFVEPADVGRLRYGSELVDFTVDSELPDGLASWFYDDDGVQMHNFPMIRKGRLVGLATTRETAPLIGWKASNGCCRADGFNRAPIARIPNLYMEPGPDHVSPDDLISGVDRGIYIEGQGSFSIDQERRNFQFGGDVFWLIEGGRKTRPLKKVTYQAMTTDFWRSCDGVAGRRWWATHGTPNCGKGEPLQINRMTHGASFTRFRGIQVGDGTS
jgi:TldD protein